METEIATKLLQNFSLELRRGTLVLSILSQLKEPKYGYQLLASFFEKGMELDQGTIYPMLRRLEQQGILESNWSVEQPRPRKYYHLTTKGSEILEWLIKEWEKQTEVMKRLLNE